MTWKISNITICFIKEFGLYEQFKSTAKVIGINDFLFKFLKYGNFDFSHFFLFSDYDKEAVRKLCIEILKPHIIDFFKIENINETDFLNNILWYGIFVSFNRNLTLDKYLDCLLKHNENIYFFFDKAFTWYSTNESYSIWTHTNEGLLFWQLLNDCFKAEIKKLK